MLKLGCCFP